MRKLLTLCIVHQDNRVLLGMKKRGFGAGKWNGFGGKVQEGETIEDATVRELREEAGITALSLVKFGILDFEFEHDHHVLEVHIFKCISYTGKVGESEEMRPKWFSIAEVPFSAMWKDDIFWFEKFLQSRKFRGRFLFDANDEILEHELREVVKI